MPMMGANKTRGYDKLGGIFEEALTRARDGKGRERHGGDEDFLEQPIFEMTRRLGGGPTPLLWQAVKKIYESVRLNSPSRENELLDAIVYLGAAIMVLRGDTDK